MVLVDVVMIATEELINTSQGVNLLNALTLQLGSSTQAAFSKTFNSAAAAGAQTTITRAVTIPALAYSLNIANANNAADAVLARPTLAAIEGLPSDFFSGINMNAAVISVTSLGASSTIPVDKRFGVKLAVTPAFLTNGKIQLKINAERTTLNPAVNSAGFAYRMEIAETTTNANVVMNFGDTLILSGLSEKATSESRNGVPVLQDIPVVQYLFSNKNTVNYQHSVLILVTPRLPTLASKADIQIQNPAIQALQEKLGLTTKYPSNAVSLLDHFKKSEMFREFQQGDVSVERWDRMSSTGARLKQALGFLYY
jgi:type II secretory pathway component GspD/PulD (secretin)